MGEERTTAAAVRISPPSIRLLGLLNPPEPEPDRPLELDERDVIWSTASDLSSCSPSPPSSAYSSSSSSPVTAGFRGGSDASHSSSRRAFLPGRFGLSAALAEEGGPTVRRGAGTPVAVPAARSADGGGRAPQHQSAPVNVPAWPRRRKEGFELLEEEAEEGEAEEEEEEEEEEWVPPHVMVARSHVTTFSVFEGVGRTLKGRDLRRVRNAVWRQTGFLD